MTCTRNHPWHLLADAGDFFDVEVEGHPGRKRSDDVSKIKAAAKRRCPDHTIELLPHPELTSLNIVRVTRNTSPR